MADKQKEKQLADIGKKLGKSQTKEALVKLLEEASTLLANLDQSPPQSTHNAMKGCSEALVSPTLLRHKDKDVALLVAICISEIMRIVAPDAPYSDECLKEIFQLIVDIFHGLDNINSPSFAKTVSILETVAKVRSCVVMLDLECDDLILEMFHTFFDTASDEHPQNVFVAMRNVLTLVLEESESIPTPVLEVVLKNLSKQKKEVSPAAHKLAIAIVEKCADKLEPDVQRLLTLVMCEGKLLDSGLHKNYHEVIYEIYCSAPQMLSEVIPHLIKELSSDQVNVRLKAVELLGSLFTLPGQDIPQKYRKLFKEFQKRFNDKVVEVRVAVVNCAKVFLEANSSSELAHEIKVVLQDRLSDSNDRVRLAVVKAVCDLAKTDLTNLEWASSLNRPDTDGLQKVADRLQDRKVLVRKNTLQKLLEVYRTYCTRCLEGSLNLEKEYEWIPSKIVSCCYDSNYEDLKPQALEIVLTEELFPSHIPIAEQSKHWVVSFSTFNNIEKRALRVILLQKQRLQQEMKVYLSIQQKAKEEDTPELEKKVQSSLRVIINHFVDPTNAEENLQKLHQMIDDEIFKALSSLLDTSTTLAQAAVIREDILTKLGEKHPLYEFMKVLATKCAYSFFGKEHVHFIMEGLLSKTGSAGVTILDFVSKSLSLLVEVAAYCPMLMEDVEDDLLSLLKGPDESIREGVVHIMSKAGGTFREKLTATEGRSNVNLILEQLCVEGNRKQAKYAVSAIAAMTADSGLKALSVLYGRLVDQLEDNTHLPTILQSLGCIAQNAMPIFETREDDIIKFVVRNVLRRSGSQENVDVQPNGDTPNDSVLLKIYALKALVKSFLPKANAHQRTRLPGLLKVLVKILACGEIADEMKTSDTDKAHLRLAAAKGVLRLARRWDSQIPTDVFHMVVMTVQDQAVHVRLALLLKIHQYLKDRTLNLKYASAYALSATDSVKEIVIQAHRCMTEFVDSYGKEARLAVPGQIEGTPITLHPEYALIYLVHVLAHHPNFPVASGDVSGDPTAYEPFYRELLFFLQALVRQDAKVGSKVGNKEEGGNFPAILAILHTIKSSEDVVDKSKTETLYSICDIAILITKDLGRIKMTSIDYPGIIPLPDLLYKSIGSTFPSESLKGAEAVDKTEAKGTSEAGAKVDGSYLPPCFIDKDFLTKLKSAYFVTAGQSSSPRGQKRGKQVVDGGSASEDEKEVEVSEPNHKKGKFDSKKVGKGAVPVDMGVMMKGASHSSRKSLDKNGSAKKPRRKPDSEDMKAKELLRETIETTPAKRKRGRPKGFGKKDGGISGDDTGGLSSDTTATPSAKRGKPATSDQGFLQEVVKRKPGRPAKPKSDDGHAMSAQKKEKVTISQNSVPTSEKSLKKAIPAEKSGSPAWKNEEDRGGDESLVGCGIKIWWPLDEKFYKGKVISYDAKKKKHQILYDDGEQETLNLAKERWEVTAKSKSSAKKVPSRPTTPTPPSGTKYLEPKKLKVTTKTPPAHKGELPGPRDHLRETSPKSAKQATALKEAKVATPTPREAKEAPKARKEVKEAAKASKEAKGVSKARKEVKSAIAKEQATSAFEFHDEGIEPGVYKQTSKQEKGSSTPRGSSGKQRKVDKAMRSAKDTPSESAKDVISEQPSGRQFAAPADNDEPLDTWKGRRRKVTFAKSKVVSK